MVELNLCDLKDRVTYLTSRRDHLKNTFDSLSDQINTLKAERETLELSEAAFRVLIDLEVQDCVVHTQDLLTEGLKAVFHDQNLRVEAEVRPLRGKVAVELYTIHTRSDGTEIRGLSQDAFGGAVQTVQSVLLRVLVMVRRDLRRFMLLDESLPAFDSSYVHNMGQFLSLICGRLSLDLLLVTHNPSLVQASDKAYKIVRTPEGATLETIKERSHDK